MTINLETRFATDTSSSLGLARVDAPQTVENSLSDRHGVPFISVAPVPQAPADTAAFSGTSSLVATALSDTDLRAERIESLRQSIAAGTYSVPSDVVAQSIIQSLLGGF